jgi:hypothetical protein
MDETALRHIFSLPRLYIESSVKMDPKGANYSHGELSQLPLFIESSGSNLSGVCSLALKEVRQENKNVSLANVLELRTSNQQNAHLSVHRSFGDSMVARFINICENALRLVGSFTNRN